MPKDNELIGLELLNYSPEHTLLSKQEKTNYFGDRSRELDFLARSAERSFPSIDNLTQPAESTSTSVSKDLSNIKAPKKNQFKELSEQLKKKQNAVIKLKSAIDNASGDRKKKLIQRYNNKVKELKRNQKAYNRRLNKKYPNLNKLPEDVSKRFMGQKFPQTKERPLSKEALDNTISKPDVLESPLGRLAGSFGQGVLGIGEGAAGAAEYAGIPGAESVGEEISNLSRSIAPQDPNFAENLSSGLGSMATFLLPGLGAAKGAQVLLKNAPKAAQMFGLGTMTFLESATEAGSVYRETKDPRAAEKTFLANMMLVGLTNRYDLTGQGKRALGQILKQAPLEAIQEGGQGIISETAKGKSLDQINWDNILEETAIGGIIGGGTAGMLGRSQKRLNPKEAINRLKELETQPEEGLTQEQMPKDLTKGTINLDENFETGAEKLRGEDATRIRSDKGQNLQKTPKKTEQPKRESKGEAVQQSPRTGSQNLEQQTSKQPGVVKGTPQTEQKDNNRPAIKRMLNEGKKPRETLKALGLKQNQENFKLVREVESEVQQETKTQRKEKAKQKSSFNDLSLVGAKKLVPETKSKLVENKDEIDEVFQLKADRENAKGSQKQKYTTSIRKKAEDLRKKGVNIRFENNYNKIYIDDQAVTQRKVEQPEREDLSKVEIESKEANQPYKKLGEEEYRKQVVLAQTLSDKKLLPPDLKNALPKGFGQKKIDEAIRDIEQDAGKEQSKEAQIFRDFIAKVDEELEKTGSLQIEDSKFGKQRHLTRDDLEQMIDEYETEQKKPQAQKNLERAEREFEDLKNDFMAEDKDIQAKRDEVQNLRKKLKKPPIERTKAGDQYYFGGLQAPTKGKFEGKQGTEEQTPLFQQKKEDKSQEDIFQTRIVSDDQYNQAKKNIRDKGQQFNMNLNPTILKDYLTVGAYHFERGFNKLKDFAKKMKEEGITKNIRSLYDKVKEQFSPKKESRFGESLFKDEQQYQEHQEDPLMLPEETITDKLKERFLGKIERSKKVVELPNKELDDELNYYQKARIYVGKASEMIREKIQFPMYDERNKNNFINRLEDAGFTIDDFNDYLYAKHAPEANKYLRDKFGRESGSGISDKQAQEKLELFEGSGIEKFAEEFRTKITKPLLKNLHEAGILSDEKYDNLKNFYDFYVPLKGSARESEGLNIGQGFSVSNTGVKRRKGRSSKPYYPFQQALLDYELALIRIEKNRIGKSLLEFTEDNPDIKAKVGSKTVPLFEVRGRKTIPSYDENGNLNYWNTEDIGDNEIAVYIDGKQKIITVNDPAVVRGLKNMGMEKTVALLSKFKNYLTQVITQKNPAFAPFNFLRDFGFGNAVIVSEHGVNLAGKVSKDVPKIMKGIWRGLRTDKGSYWHDWYMDAAKNGALTGWMDTKPLEEKRKDFQKKIRRLSSQKLKTTRKVIGTVNDLITDINTVAENAMRVSYYKNLVESGTTKEKAALKARELTVDFNQKGTWSYVLDSLYLFSSVSIKGTAKVFKTLNTKRGKQLAGGLIVGNMVMSILNSMIDDEYDKIPPYLKDSHFIVMLPGGKHISIPLAYGFNIFPAMGAITADILRGEEDTGGAISRFFGAFEAAFNPLGASGSFSQWVTPTPIDPVIQIGENKTFYGAPIYKEANPFIPPPPESQMHFESVRNSTKYLTTKLNELTGGSETQSGWMDVNPEVIDHLIDFLFGGVGKFIQNSGETFGSLAQLEAPEVRNVPLVRRLYGQPNDYYEKRIVYEMLEESARTKFSPKERLKYFKSLRTLLSNNEIKQSQYKRMRTTFIKGQRGKK